MASARPATKVRLQKTLKEGLRRCVYRRWEAEVQGATLLTVVTELERMYRGNTADPIGSPKVSRRVYVGPNLARAALQAAVSRRRALGYAAR
jgi:hypothetical protein